MDRVVCGDVGLRQDRGGAARRVRRRAGRSHRSPCWSPPHSSAQQHFQNVRRPLRRLAGRGSSCSPGSVRPSNRLRALKALADGKVDILIGTHKLLQKDMPVQEQLGADHRGRGAPLRRARQGAAQGAARRGGRADPDRHADPAHAQHGAGRPAGPVDHRHAAGRARWRSRRS
ncbi:MAG: hypothetical protein MZW92_16770 [Comamonadaceae bacterium]|nr:hypothetical protein [Comamonadaceae bacterium]